MVRAVRALGHLILALALVLGGCTRLREVPSEPAPLLETVKPGEKVRVTLRDGTVRELRLTAVEPEAIVAGEERIARSEIAKLERRELDVAATAAVSIGGVLLGGLILLGIAFAAVAPLAALSGG